MDICTKAVTSEKAEGTVDGGRDDRSEAQTGGGKCTHTALTLHTVAWRSAPKCELLITFGVPDGTLEGSMEFAFKVIAPRNSRHKLSCPQHGSEFRSSLFGGG
jgi:hypothetical protein